MRPTLLIGALAFAACGGGSEPTGDAGPTDGRTLDTTPATDGPVPLAWVDFTATGCELEEAETDAGVLPRCRGAAPLTVSFVPVAPAPVTEYRWRFPEDDTDSGLSLAMSPGRVYRLPGVYDVSLEAAGPGGSAAENKVGFIAVASADIGAPCDSDLQCGSENCLCAGTDCGESFPRGFCAASCDASECETGVCASLAPSAPEPLPWQSQICLAECTTLSCPEGFVCHDFAADGGWVSGCFAPGFLADMGRSCKDSDGNTNNASCASGQCVDAGSRGMCSASCAAGACPSGTACATFGGDLGSLCVAKCASSSCTGDPWLACQAPGATGAQGFAVDETADPAGYCAPKTCTESAECAADGQCNDGHCGPG